MSCFTPSPLERRPCIRQKQSISLENTCNEYRFRLVSVAGSARVWEIKKTRGRTYGVQQQRLIFPRESVGVIYGAAVNLEEFAFGRRRSATRFSRAASY